MFFLMVRFHGLWRPECCWLRRLPRSCPLRAAPIPHLGSRPKMAGNSPKILPGAKITVYSWENQWTHIQYICICMCVCMYVYIYIIYIYIYQKHPYKYVNHHPWLGTCINCKITEVGNVRLPCLISRWNDPWTWAQQGQARRVRVGPGTWILPPGHLDFDLMSTLDW